MYEALVDFDRNLFLALNSMHSPMMDSVMWWITGRFIWIPLYAFMAYFLYRKFGNQALFMVLFGAILITLSDQGSVMLKNFFERERPCHDEFISLLVHTVNNKCGGKFGFVSSHASNTMAVFAYLMLLTRHSFSRKLMVAIGFWVLIVSYSRIYLGVHFPADIIGGWLVGILAGFITYVIYRLVFASPTYHLVRK
jgi:undecaprenyl-diphosphatase